MANPTEEMANTAAQLANTREERANADAFVQASDAPFPELAKLRSSASTHLVMMEAALSAEEPELVIRLFFKYRHRMPARGYEYYARALLLKEQVHDLEEVFKLANEAGRVRPQLVWTLIKCFGALKYEYGIFHLLRRVRDETPRIVLSNPYLVRVTRRALADCSCDDRWKIYHASFFSPRQIKPHHLRSSKRRQHKL
mmetsp:Transcript_53453/g.134345  ORF Transcript_53453/g.134345 Transcript_53453/m.134345 type:complete len:198 (+) Transcript_53453:3-596(+)